MMLGAGLSACNIKTEKQIYDEARPVGDALRAKVVRAAGLVEKRPPVPAGSTCKAPKKLTFDPKSDAHDTDYLMFEEAKRGCEKQESGQPDEDLDLHFATNPLARLLRGTAKNSIYGTPSGTASAGTEDTVKRGKNVKNLVLVHARGTTLDYFLVDLAPATPAIVCAGTLDATADSSLGTHTDNYDSVTTNKKTGKEVKRVTHNDTHDDRKNALFLDGQKKLAAHVKTELGLNGLE
jgi:hypothetical protein